MVNKQSAAPRKPPGNPRPDERNAEIRLHSS